MTDLYKELAELVEQGAPVALATVIDSRGSTPREVGAKMLVRSEGRILGSVGGGCGEAQVLWDALRALTEGAARVSRVDLTGEIDDESPTNCGGIMDIFVDPLRRDAPAGLGPAEAVGLVREALGRRRAGVLVTVVGGPGAPGLAPGAKFFVDAEGTIRGAGLPESLRAGLLAEARQALRTARSRRVRLAGAVEAFCETILPPPELVVVGAGHIAVPLAQMGKLCEFAVTVLDDRASFANRERFPTADRVLVGRIAEILDGYPIGVGTCLVLVTRGHQLDQEALKRVLGRGASYLGMIGSRRRVHQVLKHLARSGFDPALLDAVHAPVGIDIGAETPAEIATAIMAEIIAVRRGGTGPFLRDKRRPVAALLRDLAGEAGDEDVAAASRDEAR
jgi:xanthine dehydrogenase accessory factor